MQSDDSLNKRKKNEQKKQIIRIDFTSMVDMNMLLITFFMFCTTLLRPQAINVDMRSKDEVEAEKENKVKESGAITILLAGNDEIYWYFGIPNLDSSSHKNSDYLIQSSYNKNGIRQFLLKRKFATYEKIQILKSDLRNQIISKEEFKQKSKKIQEQALRAGKNAPAIIIKPSEFSTYGNLVNILDEMLICNIKSYTVANLTDEDRFLLYRKTSNTAYLAGKRCAYKKIKKFHFEK